jgi:hypothetical protein
MMMQRYVEQLRRCLQSEASEQPPPNASAGVVKLANEIVSPLPTTFLLLLSIATSRILAENAGAKLVNLYQCPSIFTEQKSW